LGFDSFSLLLLLVSQSSQSISSGLLLFSCSLKRTELVLWEKFIIFDFFLGILESCLFVCFVC